MNPCPNKSCCWPNLPDARFCVVCGRPFCPEYAWDSQQTTHPDLSSGMPADLAITTEPDIARFEWSAPSYTETPPPSTSAEMLRGWIILEAEAIPPQDHEIRTSQLKIGFDQDNDIPVQWDEYISSHHAQVVLQEQTISIHDHSTNGTRVRDERFYNERRTVADGEPFILGETTFWIRLIPSFFLPTRPGEKR